jgi:hypothetical protein
MDSAPEVEVGDFEARRASEEVLDEQAEAVQREILEPQETGAELVDQSKSKLSETQEWVEVIRRESDLIDVSSGHEDASEEEIDPQGDLAASNSILFTSNCSIRLSHCRVQKVFCRQDPN